MPKKPLRSKKPTIKKSRNHDLHFTNALLEKEEKKEAELKTVVSFSELFSFAKCLDKLLILVAILMAGAHGASWPLMFLLFGDMTNSFISQEQGFHLTNISCNSSAPNVSRSIIFNSSQYEAAMNNFEGTMTQFALKYFYVGIGVCTATYIHVAFLQISCERQTYHLRKAFFRSLLRKNIAWYDKQQSGELTTRLADDLEQVKEGIGDKIGLSVQFLAQFMAGFIVGFVKGWKLTLIIVSLTPILAIGSGLLGKLMASYSAREQKQYASAGAVAEEVLSCIRTVISFNGHSQEIDKYGKALEGCKKLGVKKSLFSGLSVGMTMLIMYGAYGLAFWYGSTQVHDYYTSNGSDGLSPGDIFSVFFCVMVGSFALGSASPHITTILTAKGAAGTVFSIIKDVPTINSLDPRGLKPAKVQGLIEFQNVHFSYPTRKDVEVLKGFSLEVKPGQTLALVGTSGCGKSTIVNLIQRFYDPDGGKVLLDGLDIRDLNIHWLRGNIGVVSQDPVMFGISIAKNILLGRPGVSLEEIQAAAKMANAHSFITALPEGYDTLVGERGVQLSGGQKQRVAIARALVRDPKILLLDEATSALDSKSESIVQEALDKARKGRTTLVVAHRLSTIQNADVICVLDKGDVVEIGQHQKLMEEKGIYYNLVTLQMISEHEHDGEDEEAAGEPGLTEMSSLTSTKAAVHQVTRQPPQGGVHCQFSNAGSDTPSATKSANLFHSTSSLELVEEDGAKPGFGRMFKSNLKELPFILVGCVGAIVNGAMFPVFALFFSEIIKTYGKICEDLLKEGLFWSMMFVMMGGVSGVANLLQNVAFGYSGENLTARLRQETFKNIIRQDVEYFDNPKHSTGALATSLATDVTMVKNATGIRLGVIVQSLTSMLAGLIIALVYGWKLALAILGAVPIMIVAGSLNIKLMNGNRQRDSKLLEEAGKTASECVENIRTVQSLTREEYFYDQYCAQLNKPHKENLKQAHIYGISYSFSQGFICFLYAAAFRFGAWLVVHDDMDPSLVYRVFFAVSFTGMALGQAASFMPDYSKAQLSASYIFSLIDKVPKIDIYSSAGSTKTIISGEIQLKNVRFHYPTRPDVQILRGINIHVKPGQTAALVGMSGCGKSTIVSLVQRYYDPLEGSIVVEGKDIREYNLKFLRSMISVVSQEPILFDRNIRDNIVYGLEQEIPMADIIAAAKTANAHDFIVSMPNGYDTTVGEKGTQLSGGQKQRVAIARAIIRNPKILLLDEATSALDIENEKIVQTALDKAREGRTCIVIAHRLSTIQNADIIYIMENGRVVESGTHLELLAKKGAYSVLVEGYKFRNNSANNY